MSSTPPKRLYISMTSDLDGRNFSLFSILPKFTKFMPVWAYISLCSSTSYYHHADYVCDLFPYRVLLLWGFSFDLFEIKQQDLPTPKDQRNAHNPPCESVEIDLRIGITCFPFLWTTAHRYKAFFATETPKKHKPPHISLFLPHQKS